MNSRITAVVLTAVVLALTAGTAGPAFAQDRDHPMPHAASPASGMDFRSASWLMARKVVNNNNEPIADVSDFIVEHGTGRIESVIITTGATFGLGGRAIAVPYGSFRWESGGEDRFIMHATLEQLKQLPEYTSKGWKEMKLPLSEDKSTLGQSLAAASASPCDPYVGSLDTSKRTRIEGEITRVERVRTSTFGEQILIDVRTDSMGTRKIALGPSWYVNGTAAAPMRGDKVVVETLALQRDPDQLLAGTELRSGDRHLRLRDGDGYPAWNLKSVESGRHSDGSPYSRFLLMSQLPGMKIDCRGEECGMFMKSSSTGPRATSRCSPSIPMRISWGSMTPKSFCRGRSPR